jgi:uncharacterized LabA/DUF88 family protein
MTDVVKIAVLIDGDNADASSIEPILNEVSRFGRITIKRIYGDWTKNNMNSWKEQLNKYAIRPIQKFSYTTGKNSTDTALIIEAMDIIHSKLVEGFCIVSSDSDYTGIAHRIREEGLLIIGIGRSHTPEAFVKACDNFIYSEILTQKETENKDIQSLNDIDYTNDVTQKDNSQKATIPKLKEIKIIGKIDLTKLTNKVTNKPIDVELIDNAFKMVADQMTGQALASRLSEALRKIDPTFDIRNFGFLTFRKFSEALKPRYEVIYHDDRTTISLKRAE